MFSKGTIRSWKLKKYYEILTLSECVEKIIDYYCLQYLDDLFGIKLIILRFELNVAILWICMDATFFGKSRPNRCNR